MPYAKREGPDQTAQMRSLIRAFSVRQYIIWYTRDLCLASHKKRNWQTV